MQKHYCLLISCLLLSTVVLAQHQADRWYFGINAGLDFSSGSPVAVNDGMLSTTEGCSSIADSLGNLLFYTDGITVFNSQHDTMPNGSGLAGDISTTQSALIVPQPGNDSIYYIFTLPPDGNPGFRYSVVNMNLHNGLGDVTADKNVLILNDVSERISAVHNHNGSGYWVMVHNFPGNGFYGYLLTASGLSNTPVISNTGTVQNNTLIQNSYGYMKFSPNATRLGMAVGYQGIFELFDFNDTTGVVSNPITLPTGDRCYGLEFSGDNSKLYTTHYNIDDVYFLDQYDLSSGVEASIIASQNTIAFPDGARALQLGPDKKIYLAKAFQGALGVINYPDSLGSASDFQDFAIPLDLGTCAIGLPGFVQSYFKDKGGPVSAFAASSTIACATQCISFTNHSLNSPTSWKWIFEGAQPDTSYLENPTNICYSTPGDYDVTLITQSNMGIDTVTFDDYIHIGDTMDIPVITVNGNMLISTAATTYQWYRDSVLIPGANDQVYTATQTGAYYVVVTNAEGCTATSGNLIPITPGIEILNMHTLKLYPVPASELVVIELPGHGNYSIIITDITGRKVYEQKSTAGNLTVSCSAFSPGVYAVHAIGDKQSYTARLLKQY